MLIIVLTVLSFRIVDVFVCDFFYDLRVLDEAPVEGIDDLLIGIFARFKGSHYLLEGVHAWHNFLLLIPPLEEHPLDCFPMPGLIDFVHESLAVFADGCGVHAGVSRPLTYYNNYDAQNVEGEEAPSHGQHFYSLVSSLAI